ncbi:MAG: hypothetical protein PVF91_05655 [Chromatiales bacterium]|jgi:hypothetical protein
MSRHRQKEIEALESRIEQLKAEQEREKREKAILEEAHRALMEQLAAAGVSFDAFVRFAIRDIRRATTRIDREERPAEEKPVRRKAAKKRPARKARARKTRKQVVRPVKIPAGRYTNVPPDPAKVYEVKEKGPRPKPVKAYAEEVGIDAFLAQCRLAE